MNLERSIMHGLLFLAICTVLTAPPVDANIFLVWDQGPPQVFYRSLSDAVDAAASGDTIIVKTGEYELDQVTIDKQLTIYGEFPDSVKIYPRSQFLDGGLLVISADTCVIRQLTFVLGNGSGTGGNHFLSAIFCDGTSPIIENNTFIILGGGFMLASGILCRSTANPTIAENNFETDFGGRTLAIRLEGNANAVIAGSNYWTTQDADSIAAMVWDYYDDNNLGAVDCTPNSEERY